MLAITQTKSLRLPSPIGEGGGVSSYPAQVVELCAERANVVCRVVWIIRVHEGLGVLFVGTHFFFWRVRERDASLSSRPKFSRIFLLPPKGPNDALGDRPRSLPHVVRAAGLQPPLFESGPLGTKPHHSHDHVFLDAFKRADLLINSTTGCSQKRNGRLIQRDHGRRYHGRPKRSLYYHILREGRTTRGITSS